MGLSLRGLRKITDLFDANSQSDQQKRIAAGQPRFYADQQRQLPAAQQSPVFKAKTYGSSAFREAVPRVGIGTRDLAIGAARETLKIPETAARSFVQSRTQPFTGKSVDSPVVSDPVRGFLYGKGRPVETYQTRRQGYEAKLKDSRFRGVAGPLSAIGIAGMVASDLTPTPKPKIGIKTARTAQKVQAGLNQAAKQQVERYAVSTPTKVKNAVTRTYDPSAEAVRIDRAVAKSKGVKFRDLPANERLEQSIDVSRNSRQQVEEIFKRPTRTGDSGINVIRRYRGPAEADFNNYTNAKFDLEFRAKHKNQAIQKGVSTSDLKALVRDHEARNPRAKADLATVKALNDEAIDTIVKAGALSKADGEFVKKYYKNAVPLSRLTPDDLKRVEISARPSGSIGRQSVLQRLTGNSDIPLDNTFQPLINRLSKAVSQANRAEAAKLYLKRVKEGTAPGELRVGAGNKTVRKEVRANLKEINATIDLTKKKYARVKNPKRKAELKKQLEDLVEGKNISKETVVKFGDDSTVSQQTISGLIDGQSFKLEVPPEVGRMMQGLDEKQLDGLVKGLYGITKTFQTAWTGFLQPVFSLFSFAIYDPLASVVISKHGFKTFRPAAIAQMFRSFKTSNTFSKALKANGYLPPGGSMMARDPALNAAKMAVSDSVLGRIKFNITHSKEMLDALDVVGGKLANASRERIAKAHYVAAKKAGMTEKQALAEATYAANNVLPNYQRTSALVKQFNAAIPYSGASVAGTRSLLRALRNDPSSWGRLAAVAVAPPVAAVAYSLSSDAGEEYYKDMLESGKGYALDNSINIVLPGASKNPETGEWTGVWKLPVPPEFRAINKSIWRATAENINNGDYGASPQTVALSMFDTMTGGMRGQTNPAIDTARIVAGQDPRSSIFKPTPIVRGDLAYEDKKDQVFESTTGAAKGLAGITGNRISPVQAEEILGQFSLAGQLVQNREGNPAKTIASNIKNRVYGAYGQKEGARFFKEFDRLLAETKLDPDDRKTVIALHSSDPRPGILDSTEKATAYLNRPTVLEFDRKLDEWSRSQGKPGNPLFDLSDERLNRVLVYRQAKMLNAGKQTYDKNGNSLFLALGLDDKWYDDFRAGEDSFYSSLPKSKDDKPKAPDSFSGHPRLEKSKEIEALENKYHSMPSGTGERSRFLRANPQLLAWWELSDGFTDKERAAIGLKVYAEDGSANYGSSGKDSRYFASSKSSGGGSSRAPTGTVKLSKSKVSVPKVSVGKVTKVKSNLKAAAKPKVTIKKSKV